MAWLRWTLPSKVLHTPVEMRAFLPDTVELKDIPVAWVLHGANCDCNEWFDEGKICEAARDRGMAVISVSILNGFGVDMCYGLPYATFLETEWIPAVRRLLPCLSRKREKNAVLGASMGGFAAFRLAMNRPELFGFAGAFAGAIGLPTIMERYQRGIQPGGPDMVYAFGGYERLINNENDVVYMTKKRVAEGNCPRLYMICGTEDFGYALNTIARDDLLAAGADVTWRQGPGMHSFTCWNQWVADCLDWVTGKGEEA